MSKTDWISQEIENLQNAGLYNRIRTIGSPQGAWLTVDGKQVLNFCSNNYWDWRITRAGCGGEKIFGRDGRWSAQCAPSLDYDSAC